jgi:hypothetical protein
MIVVDLYFEGIPITPKEADTVLIVDPDAMLSVAFTFEGFQSISRENRKIRENTSGVNLYEFSLDDLRKAIVAPRVSAVENQLSIFGSERSNHNPII